MDFDVRPSPIGPKEIIWNLSFVLDQVKICLYKISLAFLKASNFPDVVIRMVSKFYKKCEILSIPLDTCL